MNNLGQCSVKIAPPEKWGAFHQYNCTRKAVVERDGNAYCKIHDPEYIKQKDKEREDKRRAKGCQNCGWNLKSWWSYCPHCGTKK